MIPVAKHRIGLGIMRLVNSFIASLVVCCPYMLMNVMLLPLSDKDINMKTDDWCRSLALQVRGASTLSAAKTLRTKHGLEFSPLYM